MKKTIYILAVMFLTALISCKDKAPVKAEVLRPVRFVTVGVSDNQKVRTFSGLAKASDEIDLSFRSSGIITELNISVGMQVKKGDLLARLDNVQAKLAYEQSISAVNSAKSAMNTAKSNLDRIKTLYAKGSNSLSDYEMAKNNYQANLDQYQSALKNKSIQKSQIDYGFIYAPKNGTIASKIAELNENAAAGQVIGVLNAGEKINIMVGLPENVINKVQLNMETALNFSSISGKSYKGIVIEISPIADPTSASYPVKIDLVAEDGKIRPGMTCDVTFEFKEQRVVDSDPSLVIPVNSVGENGDGNFVFIISSEDGKTGVVSKKNIEIGEMTTNGFAVKSGLEKGDKIATAGLQTLLDGQKVRLQ